MRQEKAKKEQKQHDVFQLLLCAITLSLFATSLCDLSNLLIAATFSPHARQPKTDSNLHPTPLSLQLT